MSISEFDPCVFIRKNNKKEVEAIVAIFVDDGIITAKKEHIVTEILSSLKKEFQITSGDLDSFLGMKVQHLKDGSIFINQEGYIRRILKRFQLENCNPVSTPCDIHQPMSLDDYPSNDKPKEVTSVPYREAVGSLMYLVVATRPDLAYAVHIVSQYLEHPYQNHWNAVKRIFKYLKGTQDLGILYQVNGEDIIGYSDADFANDKETRKSVSGYVFTYANGAISWSARKQQTVSLSTTEAEYIASCEATKEATWLKGLLQDLTGRRDGITIRMDNQSAIKLIKNPVIHKRTKHIDVRYHYVRQKLEDQTIKVEHVPGSEQLADVFTKGLPKEKHEMCCQHIGLSKISGSVGN